MILEKKVNSVNNQQDADIRKNADWKNYYA